MFNHNRKSRYPAAAGVVFSASVLATAFITPGVAKAETTWQCTTTSPANDTVNAYGDCPYDSFDVNNDAWNPGHGVQTLSADTYGYWQVTSDQDGESVETYPDVRTSASELAPQLCDLNTMTAGWNETNPAADPTPASDPNARWESAFDIWLNSNASGNGDAIEVMIWTYTNNQYPIGYGEQGYQGTTPVTTPNGFTQDGYDTTYVTSDGDTYYVYSGTNGSNPTTGNRVLTLISEYNESSGSVQILQLLDDLAAGYDPNNTAPGDPSAWQPFFSSVGSTSTPITDPPVVQVQYGWELVDTDGTQNYTMNSYALNYTTTSCS